MKNDKVLLRYIIRMIAKLATLSTNVYYNDIDFIINIIITN